MQFGVDAQPRDRNIRGAVEEYGAGGIRNIVIEDGLVAFVAA